MEILQARAVMRSSSRSLSTTLKNSSRCPGCGSLVVARRTFATTQNRGSKLRREMWQWLNGPGAVFREPSKGMTNYLGAYDRYGNPLDPARQRAQDEEQENENEKENEEDGEGVEGKDDGEDSQASVKQRGRDLRPFPLNEQFTSNRILSEDLKDEIYQRVIQKKQSIREVSISLGVDMPRVAACARMKVIEYGWKQDGKKLAVTYANAIEGMLPSTPYKKGGITRHENINELPVHPYTNNQIFYPTSESAHFTREDAAHVFNKNFLPPEKRIPHPVLVEDAARELKGVPQRARQRMLKETITTEVQKHEKRRQARNNLEEQLTTIVKGRPGGAFFRVREVSAEDMGKDPHSSKGLGWRYGNPHNDRKKGVIKIPTTVE